MRRRYTINVDTSSPLESQLIEYTNSIPQGHKRAEELRRMLMVGYQVMVQGREKDESIIESYGPEVKSALLRHMKTSTFNHHSDAEAEIAALRNMLLYQSKQEFKEDFSNTNEVKNNRFEKTITTNNQRKEPKEIKPKEIKPKEIEPKEIEPKEIEPKEIEPKEIEKSSDKEVDRNIEIPENDDFDELIEDYVDLEDEILDPMKALGF